MIISIDPGLTGAVTFFHDDSGIDFIDMPTATKTNGKGRQVCAYQLTHALSFAKDIKYAVIERVHAMPGQGVSSTFSFGRSLGIIEALIAYRNIPTVWVTPQKWKKHFGLIGKDKDAARTLAIEKHPELFAHLNRKKDIGRADSLLIGECAIQLNLWGGHD